MSNCSVVLLLRYAAASLQQSQGLMAKTVEGLGEWSNSLVCLWFFTLCIFAYYFCDKSLQTEITFAESEQRKQVLVWKRKMMICSTDVAAKFKTVTVTGNKLA